MFREIMENCMVTPAEISKMTLDQIALYWISSDETKRSAWRRRRGVKNPTKAEFDRIMSGG